MHASDGAGRRALLVAAGLLALAACDSGAPVGVSDDAATGTIRFTDVTAASGIDMTLTSGAFPSTQILEVKGGGIALIDHDGDGDLDLFAPNGATLDTPNDGPGARLFENLGGMRFRDVTATSGIAHRRWSFGAAVADFDGDRRDDIHIACFGRDVLLRNTGGGRFEDVTAAAGVGLGAWSTSAAWGDIDRDGDLDLYVTRFVVFNPARPPDRTSYMGVDVLAGPLGLKPLPDALYENLGDGTFRDVSVTRGIRVRPPANGLNAVIVDVDADGWQDILVANDSMPNFLFRNRGDGSFDEVGAASGLALNADGAPQASMGIAVGDVSGNGLPDFFTTNFSSDSNTLHVNLGGGLFEDRTARYGLGLASSPFLGWACGFGDLDHDGDEDLLIFNGHVYPEASKRGMDSPYDQAPLLFAREGAAFKVVKSVSSAGAWLEKRYRARSAVFGDLDSDGDLDVVFGELCRPLRVLRNDREGRPGGAWVVVALADARESSGNRRGIGSRITLRAGERVQTRWIHGGGPFQSTSAPEAHFALEAPAAASIDVEWPDGGRTTVSVEWGQRMTVTRRQ